MLKKIIVASMIAIGVAVTIMMSSSPERNKPVVSICKVVEHEAIDAAVSGIKDYLGDVVQFNVDTCQSNAVIASQIMSKFVSSKSDIVVAVGTTPAQVAFKFAQQKAIKLVFSSVTNPDNISASLNDSNTAGVSNFVPLEPQIELFMSLQPNMKRLGIIYNSGESNSVDIVMKLRDVVKKYGIELVEQSIQKASDIPQAVQTLIQKKVDAAFVSNDNLALASIPIIVKLCGKTPVYVSDTDQVAKGCVAALGPNQYNIGIQTGKMIGRILDGEDINAIEIEYPSSTETYLNQSKADEIGLKIPQKVSNMATKIY
ncbi:MAG: ABC transporter substrate-binding protein [Holosporales bacterium]|jgi:putative ABC transport system substrate-binding protein|nr:ABC transporter substrate-binding protein [Holosporales bacterium]